MNKQYIKKSDISCHRYNKITNIVYKTAKIDQRKKQKNRKNTIQRSMGVKYVQSIVYITQQMTKREEVPIVENSGCLLRNVSRQQVFLIIVEDEKEKK